MQAEDEGVLAGLIRGQRQAALGTLDRGAPFVSMVLYALELCPDQPEALYRFLIHVSRLSPHTRHLEADSRASLLITQPDTGEADPQTLPRVTIQLTAQTIPHDSPAYAQAKACYIARLPQSEMLFSFADFRLVALIPSEARYVGGFGKICNLSAAQLQALLSHSEPQHH